MFNNIKIMEINRKKVMQSTIVSFTLLYTALFIIISISSGIENGLAFTLIGLIYGIPIYVPAILIFLWAEYKLINSRSTKKTVAWIFLGEAILSSVVIGISYSIDLADVGTIFLLFLFALLGRFGFLLVNNRIYNKVHNRSSSIKS